MKSEKGVLACIGGSEVFEVVVGLGVSAFRARKGSWHASVGVRDRRPNGDRVETGRKGFSCIGGNEAQAAPCDVEGAAVADIRSDPGLRLGQWPARPSAQGRLSDRRRRWPFLRAGRRHWRARAPSPRRPRRSGPGLVGQLLAELVLEDLQGGVAGQAGDDLELLRDLLGHQPGLAAVLHQLRKGDRRLVRSPSRSRHRPVRRARCPAGR